MVIVGIDTHTQSHTTAVDEHGRELATVTVGAPPAELDRLRAWVNDLGPVRLVAIEGGARGVGLPITRRLIAAGVAVVDIPSHLTAFGRRSSYSRGKDDPADAVTIARMALREPGLPRLRAPHLAADLKLLVDARDRLVAEVLDRASISTTSGGTADGHLPHRSC